MPNDSGSLFPVPLTDEVAPDLSVPPTSPPPTPAAIPPSRPFPIVTILLLFISTAAIAAAYFFYQQSKSLNAQLTQITQTMQQQQIKENQTIPQAKPDLALPDTGTISATPTPTAAANDNSIFGQISAVIATATAKYPNAQLLMVTVSGVESPDSMISKYWFRQNETDKRYLYLLKEAGKNLALVDQQVYVTPDNTIPSLNQLAEAGQLGIDLPEAVKIAAAACPPNFSCNFTPISSQYIKAGTTLWQISYKPTGGAKPFVIQIDATTKKILYKNQ